MKHEFLSATLACCLALSAFASPVTAQDVIIRAATTLSDNDGAQAQGYNAFAEQVALRSGGTMAVEIFWGGTLGGDREIYEQIQAGSIHMTATADGPLAGFYPPIQAVAIPFMFSSEQHAIEFFNNGEVFARMREEMRQSTGLRVLRVGGAGFRNFTNNTQPLRTPADLAGLRMRTMESPVMMAMTRGLGAEPTPIAFNELIPSLLTGVVTGQENAVGTIRDFRIYEAQRYLSIDQHLYGPTLIVINDAFFTGLTEAQQRVILDSAQVMRDVQLVVVARRYAADIAYLREQGMEIHINTLEERALFAQAAQPAVIEFLTGRFGAELVQAVLDDAAAVDRRLYSAE